MEASCDKNNPIIEKTGNNPVPAINVGLTPILSYSFPAESGVAIAKTEPKIVAIPYVVSEKPHKDFVKIGKTIAFPIEIRYIQRFSITAILNGEY